MRVLTINVGDAVCVRCGQPFSVGDWPWCPHGHTSHSVIDDTITGGQVIENLGDAPMTFHSKKAIRDEADRRGLRIRDQWAGPHDQYLSNWGAMIDAQTLENAKILLSRGSRGAEPPDPALQLVTGKTWTRTIKKWNEIV